MKGYKPSNLEPFECKVAAVDHLLMTSAQKNIEHPNWARFNPRNNPPCPLQTSDCGTRLLHTIYGKFGSDFPIIKHNKMWTDLICSDTLIPIRHDGTFHMY